MSRLGFLVGALLLFAAAAPAVLARVVPPRWRVRLGFLTVFGMFVTTVSLLAAILLPEVLVVSSIRDIWQTCTAAFRAIWESPLGRWPSVVAGIALALVLGRFAWALVASFRVTRRARVVVGEARGGSRNGYQVHVLPVDLPEAYSVPGLRGQVVLTRGLLRVLDEDEQRAVLMHEEGHLRARHHQLLSFTKAVETALSPIVPAGWALAGLEQSVEEAADEYAASRLGSALPVATGLSKAALAGLSSPLGALSIGSGPDIPGRVRRLLDVPDVPRWMPIACVAAVALLLAVLTATQVIAGFALVAATHHLLGVGAAATCPLFR
jgi:Zn-dependent protease with chaperone function